MPRLRMPEAERSPKVRENNIRHWNALSEIILSYDLRGLKIKDIALKVGKSVQRIAQIKCSPLYLQARESATNEILRQVTEQIAHDPVNTLIREEAINAAKEKIRLFKEGQSEFVRNAAAGDILDRAGYKPESKQTITSIEITEDIAKRFERILKDDQKQIIEVQVEE